MRINAQVKNRESVLNAIKVWYNKNAYGPSYRDLALMTQIPLGTVYNVCHELRESGNIDFQDGVARTIKINS